MTLLKWKDMKQMMSFGTLSCYGEKQGLEVIILSGDRDTFQLATDKVTIRIPHTKGGKTETDEYHREKIIETYNRTKVYPMSWYSKLIWEHIFSTYKSHSGIAVTVCRDALKQNMANFMFILWTILEDCPAYGEDFLEQKLLAQHYDCFNYSYEFNSNGEIISQQPRHFTDRNQNEAERYKRIAINSVYDYNDKNNRNTNSHLNRDELKDLSSLCKELNSSHDYDECYKRLVMLVEKIERRLISSL